MAVFMTAYGLRWDVTEVVGRWGEGRSQFDSTYLAEDSVGRRDHWRVGVRGLGLPEPQCRARGGQRLVDLRRVGRRLGFGGVQRPIKSIPPGRDRSQRFCLCVCVPASISGPAHSRREPRLIMNCWQTSSELFSLSLFIASSCCFSLSIKKRKVVFNLFSFVFVFLFHLPRRGPICALIEPEASAAARQAELPQELK